MNNTQSHENEYGRDHSGFGMTPSHKEIEKVVDKLVRLPLIRRISLKIKGIINHGK